MKITPPTLDISEQQLSVLIVEDSRVVRSMALECITGCRKFSAATFKEGLAAFLDKKPNIVFLDINLPDGNGLDLLKNIKSMSPETYVVMFTSSQDANDVKKAKEDGAAGYIVKPFNKEKLQRHIDHYRTIMKGGKQG